MSKNISEPASINAVVKWTALACALACVIVVFAATRFAYVEPNISPTPSSPPGSMLGSSVLKSRDLTSRAAKLCFTRGDWIYLKDLGSGTETKLVEGMWPDLSPDGNSILFMASGGRDVKDDWPVRILDLTSLQVREFSALAGRRIWRPSWSNDGKKIAFVTTNPDFSSSDIAVFEPATGELKNLTEKLNLGYGEGGTTFDSWVGDQSVLFHTLENLYEVSVHGTLVSKIPIANLRIDSNTRFSFSADKKRLLFEQMEDTGGDPNDRASILNLDNDVVTRITPDTVEARSSRWLPSQREIIFTCLKRSAKPPYTTDICTIGIDGTGLKVLARNADIASFSIE